MHKCGCVRISCLLVLNYGKVYCAQLSRGKPTLHKDTRKACTLCDTHTKEKKHTHTGNYPVGCTHVPAPCVRAHTYQLNVVDLHAQGDVPELEGAARLDGRIRPRKQHISGLYAIGGDVVLVLCWTQAICGRTQACAHTNIMILTMHVGTNSVLHICRFHRGTMFAI